MDQQYPELANDNDKRTLRRLAMGFFLDKDILYKKSKDQILLRCVDANKAKKIVHVIHEGVCGTHASGHVMARQIMRVGYY